MGNNPVSNIDPNGCAYTGYGSLSDMYYRAYYSDFTGHGGHLGSEREIYFRRNDQTVSTARIDELISSRFTNEISCYSLFGDWKAEKIKAFYKMQEDLARKAEMDKILAYLNEPGPKESNAMASEAGTDGSEALDELAMMLQNASTTGLSFGGPEEKNVSNQIVFPGVTIISNSEMSHGIFDPFLKTIYVPGNLTNENLHDYTVHEYGHYLQLKNLQEKYGNASGLLTFVLTIGLTSLTDAGWNSNHINTSIEKDANNRATDYWQRKFDSNPFYYPQNWPSH